MTIINTTGECYVTLCPKCGTSFRYGPKDIIPAETVNGIACPSGVNYEHMFCPTCGNPVWADKEIREEYLRYKEY